MSKKVKFMSWVCGIEKENYHGTNAIALLLTHPEDGPIATASVNLPEFGALPQDCTWIKTWSENEGIFEALIEAEIIEDLKLEVPVNEFGSTAKLAKVLI